MGPVEVLWDGDGVTPPPPPEPTDACEKITSRRTTHADGKNYELIYNRFFVDINRHTVVEDESLNLWLFAKESNFHAFKV